MMDFEYASELVISMGKMILLSSTNFSPTCSEPPELVEKIMKYSGCKLNQTEKGNVHLSMKEQLPQF